VSQPLVIRKDPNSAGSEADIATQIAMATELRSDLETAVDMVNQIEQLRSQLYSITSLLGLPAPNTAATGTAGVSPAMSPDRREPGTSGASADYAAIKSAADALDNKLIEIEDNLIQRRLTGQGQDTVRWPPKLLSKINYLGQGLTAADFPPTNQHREVQALLKSQLASHRSRLDDVLSKDLTAFNSLLHDRGIGNVIVPK